MTNLKVAIVSPTFPPSNSGLGNVAMQQACALSKMNCQVDVLTGGILDEVEAKDGLSIHRFNIRGSLSLINFLRGSVWSYIKFLRSSEYDIVICHAAQNWATDLALIFAPKRSLRIYYSHCVSINERTYGSRIKVAARKASLVLYHIFLYQILNRADACVFLGHRSDGPRCSDKARLAHKPQTVIRNPPTFTIRNTEKSKTQYELELLCVGEMSFMKGQDQIIEALKRCRLPKTRVTFCAQRDTHFGKTIHENTRAFFQGTEISFEFIFGKSTKELGEFYRRADLFLYASRTECYPLVLADCAAFGLPFIALDTGYIREITGGVAVTSVADMAATVQRFVDGNATFTPPNDYGQVTWDGAASELLEFSAELLASRRKDD